jgi:hypothetical protein
MKRDAKEVLHRFFGETEVMNLNVPGDVRSLAKQSDDAREAVEHIKDPARRRGAQGGNQVLEGRDGVIHLP